MTLDNKRINIIITTCLTAIFFVGSYFIVTQEIVNIEHNLTTTSAERASNVKAKFVLVQSFIETLRDNMQQSLTWQAEVKENHGALDSFVDYPSFGITVISKDRSLDKTKYWYDISGVVAASGSKKDLTEESKNEISATIQMQSIFENAVNTIPDLMWAYYISKQSFIYVFPYYESKLSNLVVDAFEKEYWIKAASANNPDRRLVMTDVYADVSGKGYMVTFSIPVYNKDSMKGIVAIDLSLASINELLSEDLQIGSSFLLDEKNTILA
ncbi:MAG: hypothetical protein ACI9N9_001785, partial [Enterobacterales bacterium]